jgi:NifB/MoaA-like Fe-S oxidoreductase
LKNFYPFVSSIAVVPVGQTKHRANKLRPVDKDYAKRAIEELSKIKIETKKELGDDILFIADEFYIKAEMGFPDISEYADFPQIENGVGLVPLFFSEFEEALSKINNPPSPPFSKGGKVSGKKDKRFFAITGESFAPYLNKCAAKLKGYGFDIDVLTVKNNFLGESVTVAGLLTGKDILDALKKCDKEKIALIPSVALREAGDRFLDNMTPDELRRKTGMEIKIVESDAKGLIDSVLN